jgi:arginine-tRNA-protein transferase
MNKDEFNSMMTDGGAHANILSLQDQDKLIGALLFDQFLDGTSAIYSFYSQDNEYKKRSLGTQLILSLISYTQTVGLDYVYLGYWIKESQKMSYKQNFPALEKLSQQGWIDFASDED